MICCDNLVHPFQHDAGTSQRQRVIEDLLAGSAQIDGRKLADLLDYFARLSKHINFYDSQLNIGDWQPFFRKSAPFSLAKIIRYDVKSAQRKFDAYDKLFKKKPSRQQLQLMTHFIYYQAIRPFHQWHSEFKGSELPIERILEKIIRDKLQEPVKRFICLHNLAMQKYRIKGIDFTKLQQSPVWNLTPADLRSNGCFVSTAPTKRKRLIALKKEIAGLLPGLLNVTAIIGTGAELSMEQSLIPIKEEFQQKHSPHLALLFAFLKLFNHLQQDMNGYTRRHLDFFYLDVLKLQARTATPDRAHILIELQNQLDKYLVKKGTQVKDGKDENKAEINFAMADELVVNRTSVADLRTLFLNYRDVHDTSYLEGAYIAPSASKADGIELDFVDPAPRNWSTLGAKLSKYVDPEMRFTKPHPAARIGFVLASPVLYLKEGTRNIKITLDCELHNDYCKELMESASTTVTNSCCEGEVLTTDPGNCQPSTVTPIPACRIYDQVQSELNKVYYYISKERIQLAIKKGLAQGIIDRLFSFLKKTEAAMCYCPTETTDFDKTVSQNDFNIFNAAEQEAMKDIFPPERVFSIKFSGEKEWIEPSEITQLQISPNTNFNPPNLSCTGVQNVYDFQIVIDVTLNPDKGAVVFFNKENLKEELDSTDPLVKIELNDHIKLQYQRQSFRAFLKRLPQEDETCCLDKPVNFFEENISLYHFFRNVLLKDAANSLTGIDVQVCGLKNFITQFENTPMDPKGPVFPWGPRPDVVDSNIVTASKVYCITQEFIADAHALLISAPTENKLTALLQISDPYKVGNSDNDIKVFFGVLAAPAADEAILTSLFNSPKEYYPKNLIGPDFYIGSKEIFCKKWTEVYVNMNWKDRPVDFNEYYLAYWADPTLPPSPPPPGFKQKYGLDKDQFQINLSVLQDGKWKSEIKHPAVTPPGPPPPFAADVTLLNPKTGFFNRRLFPDTNLSSFCNAPNPFEQTIYLKNTYFNQLRSEYKLGQQELEKYDPGMREGFLKINLQNQDFLHKDYAFALARQMMALGKYPDSLLEGAVYRDAGGTVIVFKNFAGALAELKKNITKTATDANQVKLDTKDVYDTFNADVGYVPAPNPPNIPPNPEDPPPPIPFPVPNPPPDLPLNSITDTDRDILLYKIRRAYGDSYDLNSTAKGAEDKLQLLELIYSMIDNTGKVVRPLNIPIPNEPWTPVIKEMSLDYKATANIHDMSLIHLYPYKDTYKRVDIEHRPTLFPTHCAEGTLHLGLQDAVPGSNLSLLFQLAEATADSEAVKEELTWHYLDNNTWKELKKKSEVLEDATQGLTTSGIIKLALPANMTKDNTILPKDLHWIKVSIPRNSRGIAETIGIHAQAVQVIFTNEPENDKLRLGKALSAGSLAKLRDADPFVKSVTQPYDSFGGREPEIEKNFYTRASELLRHKGRAIQKWDYERLTLERFPVIYKTKCINHSFALDANKYYNDFPVAPGYVLLAVIPDLTQLQAGNSFEPKAPVSILEEIEDYLKKRTSPFVRLRVMNPRYERIDLCLKVKLYKGKDEVFYKEKLREDLRKFLAPWAVGEYAKLTFGQCVNRSDLLRFLEGLDYLDYIISLQMKHERDTSMNATVQEICPHTPRSILLAGNIEICIRQDDCEEWDTCLDGKVRVNCCDHPTVPVHTFCKPVPENA